MNLAERQQQFEDAVTGATPVRCRNAGCQELSGFEQRQGLSKAACCLHHNLEAVFGKRRGGKTEPLRSSSLLCVMKFPPEDEVYFAVTGQRRGRAGSTRAA